MARARMDFRDWRSGDRDPLIPPRRMGLPSHVPVLGERLVRALAGAGGLGPNGDVLDIGCGPGRVAAPLTRYLSAEGRYEGFDVVPKSVRWCRRRIHQRHPNFNFQLANLHNRQYNPGGAVAAEEYRFPYPDGSFDAALAASLFTHLQPFESEHYLREAARVLRPSGRLLSSWFLLNAESEELIAAGRARRPGMFDDKPLRLEYELNDGRGNRYRANRVDVPEHQIAIYEDDVRAWHEAAGMQVIQIRYGAWAGREPGPEEIGQDLVIAERT
jgi:SAM-dependent methyltransferase